MVVTGGYVWNGTDWVGGSRVQVYNTDGEVDQLPDINTARYHHACGHYIKDDKVVILNKYR